MAIIFAVRKRTDADQWWSFLLFGEELTQISGGHFCQGSIKLAGKYERQLQFLHVGMETRLSYGKHQGLFSLSRHRLQRAVGV